MGSNRNLESRCGSGYTDRIRLGEHMLSLSVLIRICSMSVLLTGLALNSDGELMVLSDNADYFQSRLMKFTQDGQLVLSTPFLPSVFCDNPERAKLRFLECVGDTVFVSDLGIYF